MSAATPARALRPSPLFPGPWPGPRVDLRRSDLSPTLGHIPPSAGPDAPSLLGSPLWRDSPGRSVNPFREGTDTGQQSAPPGGKGGLALPHGTPRSQGPESWECWRPWLRPPMLRAARKVRWLSEGQGWGWTQQGGCEHLPRYGQDRLASSSVTSLGLASALCTEPTPPSRAPHSPDDITRGRLPTCAGGSRTTGRNRTASRAWRGLRDPSVRCPARPP